MPTSALPWEVKLEVIRGQAKNKLRAVRTPAYLIGAADDCDMVLGDPRFSDVHICILIKPEGVWLRHVGFLPEITVNGIKTTKLLLADGDVLRTGPYEFRINIFKRLERPDSDSTDEISTRIDAPHLRIHPASMDAEVRSQVAQLVADIRSAMSIHSAKVSEPKVKQPESSRVDRVLLPPIWNTSEQEFKRA